MIPLSELEKAQIKDAVFATIEDQTTAKALPARRTYSSRMRYPMAAAVIGLLFLPLFLFVPVKNSSNITEKTGEEETKRIILPDGSSIVLNAHSSIKYSNNFSSDPVREVFLQGNGYFAVKKDSRFRPFKVYANTLAVTVLGTEFNVNTRSPATEIALTSGSVRVDKPGTANRPALLSPGERIVVDSVGRTLSRSTFNPELYAAWLSGNWVFHKTSLEEIMRLVRAYYGKEIVFPKEKYKQLQMTAMIPVGKLQDLIPVINETLGLHIIQLNNKLFIQ